MNTEKIIFLGIINSIEEYITIGEDENGKLFYDLDENKEP
jgi:hypothetical protein